ncbi:MAG TPA: hypothetical protein VLT33_06530 [Labilithrix sp.]|nr:hypothetical protein [Labilithrix sp.]
MRGARPALVVLLAAACTPAAAHPPASKPAPELAVVDVVKGRAPASLPSPELSTAIAAAVASAPDWPRPVPSPDPPATPTKPEGHLVHPVCVGPVRQAKERPHKAVCCYPAKELLVRPIRAAYPALRACYDARKKKDAEGRVVFQFRVEQDGSIPRVCSGDSTSMDDEDSVRCMVGVMQQVRFPAMSDAERDFCGLFSFNYPVIFEP